MNINGTVVGGRAEDPSWSLDRDSGERFFFKRVDFPVALDSTPRVTLGISHLDFCAGHVQLETAALTPVTLYSVEAIDIDPSGFTLSVKTWLDCRLNRVEVAYLASAEGPPNADDGVVLRDVTIREHLSCANLFLGKGNTFRLGLDPQLVYVTINVWSGTLLVVAEEISSGVPGQRVLGPGESFNFVGKCEGDPNDATTKRGYVNFIGSTNVQCCFTIRNLDEGAGLVAVNGEPDVG